MYLGIYFSAHHVHVSALTAALIGGDTYWSPSSALLVMTSSRLSAYTASTCAISFCRILNTSSNGSFCRILLLWPSYKINKSVNVEPCATTCEDQVEHSLKRCGSWQFGRVYQHRLPQLWLAARALYINGHTFVPIS